MVQLIGNDDKALELVETWLQSGTEFDAIIALNDDAGLGCRMLWQLMEKNPSDY